MNKKFIFIKTLLLILSISTYAQKQIKPSISFSFDDGDTSDILSYKAEYWNEQIVKQLKKHKINAVWFVEGRKVDSPKGKILLKKWGDAGNFLANHTYTHINFNDSILSVKSFINEIQQCDSLIKSFKNYKNIFRFPYLKCGNTIAKRDSLSNYLKSINYKQGWVTVDASDWYINGRLIKRLQENPNSDISGFRKYYVNHIVNRAKYYNKLSVTLNKRQIKHVALLHFNLTSALFLTDLITEFKKQGWQIGNYSNAIKDPIYKTLPNNMPAVQSLIWLMAKQNKFYENKLRYPGENGDYEAKAMDKLGL